MGLRNPYILDGMELYHLLNRGVDKRDIFLDEKDHVRFVHDMYEFNNTKSVTNTAYRFNKKQKYMGLRNPYILEDNTVKRETIVSVHAWCLMKNHYHLLLSENVEGGITKFIRKLNIGYANYFNERYERSGTLFQGRTKKKQIDSDSYFLHILHYIHLNPLDMHGGSKKWRNRKITNTNNALKFLQNYKWSSYSDYAGVQNFPSILTTSLFKDVFGDIEEKTKQYIKSIEIEKLKEYLLE